MSIKILAGGLKGLYLSAPNTNTTRPLISRVKKSLFDIINQDVIDSYFLDLFSGSGNVGIEAISRHAEGVVFVERDKTAYNYIEENIKKFRIQDKCLIFKEDVFKFLLTYDKKFDIIFAGPPYPLNLANKVLDFISKSKLLHDGTIIIIQHSFKEKVKEQILNLSLSKTKNYGETVLSFYEIKDI